MDSAHSCVYDTALIRQLGDSLVTAWGEVARKSRERGPIASENKVRKAYSKFQQRYVLCTYEEGQELGMTVNWMVGFRACALLLYGCSAR